MEPHTNICISEIIQNRDCKNNIEHLILTIKDTLNCDTLKLKGMNQNIFQDHLNGNKKSDEALSVTKDSGDILSLYDASDIDYDEEISKTYFSESTPGILEGTNEKIATVPRSSQDHDQKSCTYTDNDVRKEGNFISNENIDPIDINHQLDDKNYEKHDFDGISNNDCSESDLDIKLDNSFVSEYEISLLEDTDSILSEESIDSEYEISLLEDEVIDDENKNDSREKSDSNADSNYLFSSDITNENFTSPQGHIKEQENEQSTENFNLTERNTSSFTEEKIPFNCQKNVEISQLANNTDPILSEESFDSKYEISLLEDDRTDAEDRRDLYEDSNADQKKEKIKAIKQEHVQDKKNKQTSDNVILYTESINKSDIAITCNVEKNPSCKKIKISNKTDSELKIITEVKMQKINKIESNEYTNEKTEQEFKTITGDEIVSKLDKPTTLKYEKPDIKKEPSENTNDSDFVLKFEINNESRIQNKGILNKNELKSSEETTVIVNTNKHLADSASTNTTTNAKFLKTEEDAPDIGKSKQNINDEFQLSNKVEFNNKKNETQKSEKELININKGFTESTSADKAMGEKTLLRDLGISVSNESKQEVKDTIPDYYEEEKEDLINPGWNKIKELSTDEERYRQVRDCWRSKSIPNPFKNLTYYSYRKHKINCGEENTHQVRQHKRHASSNLSDKNSKRSRSCTYIFDDRIKSIEKEKETRTKTLYDKMFNEVGRLNELHHKEEKGIQKYYGFNFDPRRQYELNSLRRVYQQKVSSVNAEYDQKLNDCYNQYASEINKLKNYRNEVLQFYSFYKGLNKNEYDDPTILTNTQMQELEEIEKIYSQMDHYYR